MDLEPERVAELQREGAVELVDVREDHEWAAGRIAGARHVEMSRLTAEADTIPRDAPVVFYCRVGGRSAMAASAFRRAGYDAYNLIGGLEEWAARGLPLEPQDGRVAEH
jgi:rhodanese-related sulfurtransferase